LAFIIDLEIRFLAGPFILMYQVVVSSLTSFLGFS